MRHSADTLRVGFVSLIWEVFRFWIYVIVSVCAHSIFSYVVRIYVFLYLAVSHMDHCMTVLITVYCFCSFLYEVDVVSLMQCI